MTFPFTSMDPSRVVAYFSMEIALESSIPTYAGGLGVLAGDTLRAAADKGLPLIGVTLLHRKGYFHQRLDVSGTQHSDPVVWDPAEHLTALPHRVTVQIEGRDVHLRAWRYLVRGQGRYVPVFLLDSSLPENAPEDRAITNALYGGDERNRLRQAAVLGLGGAAMLEALGYRDIATYHMNEGHSALLALALWRRELGERSLCEIRPTDIARARSRCVFTTHTPVPAGHDRFPLSMVEEALGAEATEALCATGACEDGMLNMTYLALAGSRFINGVAMRHGEVSRGMFPDYPIHSITNGVHAGTWVTERFAALFDRYVPRWREQNSNLRYATSIPLGMIRDAHDEVKRALLEAVRAQTDEQLSEQALTIGFARRATAYKQSDLIFTDLERLRGIARREGPLQLIFAGKAHPADEAGQRMIERVFAASEALRGDVTVVYLENYDMTLANLLVAGSDVWLNTPQRPHEASGTSGMKAALNGVPSLSVLDGWWIEGHIEGVTGWAIGESGHLPADVESDAASLYDKLEHAILPVYYDRPDEYAHVMRSAIALNGSFFTTERMVLQYMESAYRLQD